MWASVQVNTVEHQQSTELWLCVFLRRPVVITNLNNRASTIPWTTELWCFEPDVCDFHRITCPEPVTLWSLVLISTIDGVPKPHFMWCIMRYNTEASSKHVSRLQLELHHSESEQQGALYQSERAAGTASCTHCQELKLEEESTYWGPTPSIPDFTSKNKGPNVPTRMVIPVIFNSFLLLFYYFNSVHIKHFERPLCMKCAM